MNLETRVETLEHELKILKNEIEETLLEIQNQVLIHYYPALRAEDSTPPQEALKSVNDRTNRTGERTPAATNAAREMDKAIGTDAVQMKEIALNDHGGFVHEDNGAAPKQAVQRAELVIDPSKLSQLSMWSTFAVERIGKAEALQMVESCPEAIGCTPAVKAALHQLIVLCRADNAPPKVDTTALMEVFVKLHTLFAEVAGRQPPEPGQSVDLFRDSSDG